LNGPQLFAFCLHGVERLATGVPIEGCQEDTDGQQGQPLDRDRDTFGVPLVQPLGDEPGRERKEGHGQQEQQVDSLEYRI
jgi:hypothetical protein